MLRDELSSTYTSNVTLVFIRIAASNISLVTNAFDFKSAQVF